MTVLTAEYTPLEGVRLGRRTYPTVIDLERANRAQALFLDLHEHAAPGDRA